MPIELKMPALSPTMEEGTLAKWLVKEGDTVKSGDLLAEIETDKATMEVESVDTGVVNKIIVAEGTEGVKVELLKGGIAEDELKAIDKEIKDIVVEAAKFSEEAPEPEAAELYTDVLVESY